MREPIHTVVKLRCKQLFGFIPEHFEIRFKPLRILTAEQEENILDKKFNRASALYSQGIITGKEFCEIMKKENILTMDTEVGKGSREPEPPQAPLSVNPPKDMVSAPDTAKTNRKELVHAT